MAVLGAGEHHTHSMISQMPDLTTTPATVSGRLAFQRAGVAPAEIDVAEVYDSFTYTVLVTLEDLGFCAKGEGGAFVSGGRTGPGGAFPLNTQGGGLSYTHPGMFGIFPIVEAVRQLRGDYLATGPAAAPGAGCPAGPRPRHRGRLLRRGHGHPGHLTPGGAGRRVGEVSQRIASGWRSGARGGILCGADGAPPLAPAGPGDPPLLGEPAHPRPGLAVVRGLPGPRFYPRPVCPRCFGVHLEWRPASGRGALYSFTIVHRAPGPELQGAVPYVVALVDLEEGVRLMATLQDVDAGSGGPADRDAPGAGLRRRERGGDPPPLPPRPVTAARRRHRAGRRRNEAAVRAREKRKA